MSRARPSPSCNKCWPGIHSGRLKILYQYAPESADVSGDRVNSVTIRHLKTQGSNYFTLRSSWMPPSSAICFRWRASNMLPAPSPNPKQNRMPLTAIRRRICRGFILFAVDYLEGRTTIEACPLRFLAEYKPDFWHKLLSLTAVKPSTNGRSSMRSFRDTASFRSINTGKSWTQHFAEGTFESSVSLALTAARKTTGWAPFRCAEGRRPSYLSSQTACPCWWYAECLGGWREGLSRTAPASRCGRNGRRDGHVSLHPRGRENSGRVYGAWRHVATESRPDGASETFPDSVGIGCYRIDLHPSTGERPSDISSLPFQIPLGGNSETDEECAGPAKHRGHPHYEQAATGASVEWNIGEAAGYCVATAWTMIFCRRKSERRRKSSPANSSVKASSWHGRHCAQSDPPLYRNAKKPAQGHRPWAGLSFRS